MAALLALCSAGVYGIGDFFGGLASRRASANAVVLASHAVGLALVVLTLPFVDGVLRGGDLVLGAGAGLAGAAGVGFLYRGLSVGPMGLVAPVTALLAAAVPVGVGLATGDDPSAPALVGMALALVAIVLVSAEGGGTWRPSDPTVVVFALMAGLGFGTFFVVISHAGDDAGTWPLLAARGASVTVLGSLALAGRIEHRVPRAALPHTAVAGALDVTANLLYLLAVREGLLSVVGLLSSLYPVSTVVLARIVLGERFVAVQRAGMVVAITATVLMTA
jgi:uncharacterized membrane protein